MAPGPTDWWPETVFEETAALMEEGIVGGFGVRTGIGIEEALATTGCINGKRIDTDNICISGPTTGITTGITDMFTHRGTIDITGITIPTDRPTGITDTTKTGNSVSQRGLFF